MQIISRHMLITVAPNKTLSHAILPSKYFIFHPLAFQRQARNPSVEQKYMYMYVIKQ